jgi:hypothetical protein
MTIALLKLVHMLAIVLWVGVNLALGVVVIALAVLRV